MTVHSLTAKRIDDLHVQLHVHCSSGFYIRSLADDLGQALGCGAHVVELRRTDIKALSVDNALPLDGLESMSLAQVLQPIDCLLGDMPQITISDAQAQSLIQGRATAAEGLLTDQLSRLYLPTGRLFAIGEVLPNAQLKTHRIFVENE